MIVANTSMTESDKDYIMSNDPYFYKELNDSLFPVTCHPDVSSNEYITVGQAFEGISIFGGTGSGKTSGSGRTIALSLLNKGWGGLVLTAKPDERELWECYLREAGRENDAVVVDETYRHSIDMFGYEYQTNGQRSAFTAEIVAVFIAAMGGGRAQKEPTDDPFWRDATRQLLTNAIDLAIFANDRLSLGDVLEISATLRRAMRLRIVKLTSKSLPQTI